MSALLTLDSLSLTTPDAKALFSGLSLTLGHERIGLVGRNGCGKSSLLAVLAGTVRPETGTVTRAGVCGLLDQSIATEGRRWADGLGVAQAWDCLHRILDGTADEADFDAADWTLEHRIDQALTQVGLPRRDLDSPLGAMSGGQRTRLALACLLLEQPDVLLLDEPSNNLDAEGRRLIAELMASWSGGVVLASHDRSLLEHMDRIVELTPAGCHIVTGGWSAFTAERDARRARLAGEIARAQSGLDQARREAQQRQERKDRSDGKGRAARQSGSQSKLILNAMREKAQGTDGRAAATSARQMEEARETLVQAREQLEILTPLAIELPASGLGSHQRVLSLDNVGFKRPGGFGLAGVSLEMAGPARVRLTGCNGSGKSTLLALAAGQLAPTSGEIWRRERRVAMLDQHAELLDPALSLLANLRLRHPHLTENAARAHLASFAFRNEAGLKPASVLSGGERLRAGLALLSAAADAPQLLILDEPTNHLDLEAIELLEQALAGYDGALLIVSHDPHFCSRIGIDREIDVATFRAGGALQLGIQPDGQRSAHKRGIEP